MDWTSNLFKMRVCTVYIALNILYCKHVNIWDDSERILEYLNEINVFGRFHCACFQ